MEFRFENLISYRKLGKKTQLLIPRADHNFPFMSTQGLKGEKNSITYPIEGMGWGSKSMRTVLIH